MSFNWDQFSYAKWFKEGEPHRCGYCKNLAGSITQGMWTEELTVQAYKDLIDRGWRRSGMYCYKPALDRTCCPQYTIRCDATKFILNKSHKKVIKKINKYLCDGIINKNVPPDGDADMEENHCEIGLNRTKNVTLPKTSDIEIKVVVPPQPIQPSTSTKLKQGCGADPTKPPCKKAKLLRLERKKQKMLEKGLEYEVKSQPKQQQKRLQEFLDDIPANAKHKLKLVLTQMHKKHEDFPISAKLFEKYQMHVHNEDAFECGPEQFFDFLVDTPLKSEDGFGSFHQQYWIDDKLIAVGVIDILPQCVSSVYFFYDPDYRDLTLGTYGSLREIQLVLDYQKTNPEMQFYYMGFYIHSCPKMRYKGKLNPSFLLCPETYSWFPIAKCIAKLDRNKYSRFNDDIDALDENCCSSEDLECIKVVMNENLYLLKDFLAKYNGFDDVFADIGRLVGKKAVRNTIFFVE